MHLNLSLSKTFFLKIQSLALKIFHFAIIRKLKRKTKILSLSAIRGSLQLFVEKLQPSVSFPTFLTPDPVRCYLTVKRE